MTATDGTIVRVNLSTGRVTREDAAPYRQLAVGGRGVNHVILLRELALGTAPFDPANIIAFGAGLLVGTGAPAGCRLSIDSLNALTGGIGSANVGGNFAPAMRAAGVDHLVVVGRAPRPVYLAIERGEVEIRDAESMWGMTTGEADRALVADLGLGAQALCIGPAGERQVRSACIIVNRARAAGRCGLGAVMGSKNLKGIVARGRGRIGVRDPGEFAKAVRELNHRLDGHEFTSLRRKYGVYCYDPWTVESSWRNFQGGRVPALEQTAAVSADAFLPYKVGSKACQSCPIGCWAVHRFEWDGREVECQGLQGNDPPNFAAKLNLFDARSVMLAHQLCNDLGLDTDNAAGVAAWAFESWQRGTLGPADTGGLSLEWGNAEVVMELLRRIAYREGIGDVLAEGAFRAAQILGGMDWAVHIKGQDLLEDMRASIGWALGTAVASRGGTHTRGAVQEGRLSRLDPAEAVKLFGCEVGQLPDYRGKERVVWFFERLEAMLDALGVCVFTNSLRADLLLPSDYARLVRAATGWEVDEETFMELGERLVTMEKLFNVRHRGWTAEDDWPPTRFFREGIVNGPAEGQRLDEGEWGELLRRYYRVHGWDEETGWPTEERIRALGLDEWA